MLSTQNAGITDRRVLSVQAHRGLDMMAYGVPFRLSAETDGLIDQMRRYAPHGAVECSRRVPASRTFSLSRLEPFGRYRVEANGELLADTPALGSALDQLSGHMMVHVAEHTPDFVFLHAGVVAWQERALLLPGVSFAGKSTLVAELVRAGATYYSDEFALLDPEGRVHPFARDLRMRRPGLPDQTPVPVSQMHGRAGVAALPVSLVVFTQFEPGARWAPESLSPGRAVLELLLHSVPVQRTPARVLATHSAMMRHATAWRSLRGEATTVAMSLLTALAAGGPPA